MPRRTLTLLALTTLLCTGCVPDVVWLPDSSGIVYTISDWPFDQPAKDRKQDQKSWLIHYDLKTKAARELARIKGHTIRLAIRPNTQHIAIVESQQNAIQVLLLDLQGKIVHRSKSVPWQKTNREGQNFFQLFWSPDGSKLLISESQLAIYDVKDDTSNNLGPMAAVNYGSTPLTPDGKQILAANFQKELFLVNWDGTKTPIEASPNLLQGKNAENILIPSGVCWSRWDGATAVSLWRGKQGRIDTVKKQATIRDVDSSTWSFEGKEVLQHYQFPGGKTSIVVLFKASYRDFNDAGVQTCYVDLLGPEPQQRKTLITSTFHCGIYPSPNQELAALRYTDDKANELIMIINKKGETVAEISAEKK